MKLGRVHIVLGFITGALILGGYLTLSVGPEPALAQQAPPEVRISTGATVTRSDTVEVSVTITPTTPGMLTPVVNSIQQNPVPAAANVVVRLRREGANTISLRLNPANAAIPHVDSNSLVVNRDTVGPILQHAEVVELAATGTTVLATFADDDFKSPIARDEFQVIRQDKDGKFLSGNRMPSQGTPEVVGRTVRVHFGSLPAGLYRLVVKGTKGASTTNGSEASESVLTDRLDNVAGGGKDQTWEFAVEAGRKFGQHVEFAPFTPPTSQIIPDDGFNPGDFVETRVARLYYYRDAHRVAEIINRNVRSYNRAAVTQAERRAEKARDQADDATDARRQAEREAVQAAEQARNAEQKLESARQALAEVQSLQNNIAGQNTRETEINRRLAALPAGHPDQAQLTRELEEVRQRRARDQQNLAQFGATDQLPATVRGMEQSVANLRQTELVKREAAQQAEAKEARARAQQFRDEVSAANTDPDTYVAGDTHSVDPVTQVSISVIGEGLIQLRGPIKGINSIRKMINEIDSPVGQIKIGVFTVQVNGERGDKMEKVVGDAEGHIDLARFLVNQSLNLLRRAIQAEAAMIAEQCAMEGHYQVDRDRRYLYLFFGRDFIDELYAMNSEFLFTENKLLSLHAMDTVSLNRALFILALAKNDVRERIIARFLESAKTELADAEFDFRRSSELRPHRTEKHLPPWNRTHLPLHNKVPLESKIYEAVHRNAMQRYHFRNFSGFFDTSFGHPDTMNPMQREFIRLAQIFKARLVAEMEMKQRVLERGLIEDPKRANDDKELAQIMEDVRRRALSNVREAYLSRLEAEQKLHAARIATDRVFAALTEIDQQLLEIETTTNDVLALLRGQNEARVRRLGIVASDRLISIAKRILDSDWLADSERPPVTSMRDALQTLNTSLAGDQPFTEDDGNGLFDLAGHRNTLKRLLGNTRVEWETIRAQLQQFELATATDSTDERTALAVAAREYTQFQSTLDRVPSSQLSRDINSSVASVINAMKAVESAQTRVNKAESQLKTNRVPLDQRKLLNHLIDEQEDKFIELVEGTRSHIAVMDDYLKRLSIALEDDFKVQFYDPAFVQVRDAARAAAVNLGQVERTTILTNNRAFAKVDPQATMEFDLPKRQIAIKEAFDAAKALVEDTGALVNDPTFLAAFQMMGGSRQPSNVRNVLPGLSTNTDQQTLGLVPQQPEAAGTPGSALQSLVPEPSIFKLETGTGFQIRPVMQPDGDSVVYDFDYMYTTNIREPVRADEKHLGRIKRHFIHTSVQTGNFELREISRYQVALKASRTSRGVPLLEDIPVVGLAFKPAPSDESSIQQNIIFGQTNVYPTLFDLMGLRWAQQVVDLNHTSLLEAEHIIRGRQKSLRDHVYGVTSKHVDEFLGITSPHRRPDLYHSQGLPSPHHPSGYSYEHHHPDPTGNGYEQFDRRPPDMQMPPYELYRHRPLAPETVPPGALPEQIPLEDSRWRPNHSDQPTNELSSRRPNGRIQR